MTWFHILLILMSFNAVIAFTNGKSLVFSRNSVCLTANSINQISLHSSAQDPTFQQRNGRPHTEVSKAKISAANKGKVPWNLGARHTEETKLLISNRIKDIYIQKRIAEASSLNISLEQFAALKLSNRSRSGCCDRSVPIKAGLTAEGRASISAAMKRRWLQPGYKEMYSIQVRGRNSHTEETRRLISAAIKRKWLDADYRERCTKRVLSVEARRKISETMKRLWRDPEYKKKMTGSQRTAEWRQRMSDCIRKKWEDTAYRNAVHTAMQKRVGYTQPTGSVRKQTSSGTRKSTVRPLPEQQDGRIHSVQKVDTVDTESLCEDECEYESEEGEGEDVVEAYGEYGELLGVYTVSEYQRLRSSR